MSHAPLHIDPASSKEIKFGTDGWRAIIADGFTFEHVGIVAYAISLYLLENFSTDKPVVIGHDTRFLADHFAQHAAHVLRSQGFSVLMTDGYTPTPAVAFAAKHYNSCGALMFTASHNPPEYCGIKFIPDYAGPATPDITNAIIAHVQAVQKTGFTLKDPQPHTTLSTFDPYQDYVAFLSEQVDFAAIAKRPPKILYDAMYGAGQRYVKRIFEEQSGYNRTGGGTLEVMHHVVDPRFGGHLPEPKDEFLEELIAKVPGAYDFGFANDGDADRFCVVDDKGRCLPTNITIPLIFRYLYHRRGWRGSVVRTVASSLLLDKLAEKYSVTLHETPVGFKYVGDWMRKEPVIVGGEESGGLSILHHIPEKDGMLAGTLLAEIIAVEGKPLSAIVEDLYEDAGFRPYNLSINLTLPEARKQSLMAEFKALKAGDVFAGRPIERINALDGVKLIFGPNDWLLLRPSGTEPILRLYGESLEEQYTLAYEKAVADRINGAVAVS